MLQFKIIACKDVHFIRFYGMDNGAIGGHSTHCNPISEQQSSFDPVDSCHPQFASVLSKIRF